MERKIETLLRLVSDMKRFEEGSTGRQIHKDSDELSIGELDLIAAARSQEYLEDPEPEKDFFK